MRDSQRPPTRSPAHSWTRLPRRRPIHDRRLVMGGVLESARASIYAGLPGAARVPCAPRRARGEAARLRSMSTSGPSSRSTREWSSASRPSGTSARAGLLSSTSCAARSCVSTRRRDRETVAHLDVPVGAIALRPDGGLLAAAGTTVALLDEEATVRVSRRAQTRMAFASTTARATRRAGSGPARWRSTRRRARGTLYRYDARGLVPMVARCPSRTGSTGAATGR